MNYKEKLEELEIDKGQLIIFLVVGLVFMFFVYGIFFRGSSEEKKPTLENLTMPENKSVEDYETKLEAYARENEPKKNNASLNFDRNTEGKEALEKTKREKLEAEIDSLLNAKKNTKQTKKQRTPRGRSRTTRTKPRIIEHEKVKTKKQEIDNSDWKKKNEAELSKFFKVSTKSQQNKTRKTTLKTDGIIHVSVNGDQTLKKGNRINLLIAKQATINGVIYPRNTKLYGFIQFGKHRVFIDINTINNNPIKLKVYDGTDGNLGLYTKVNLTGEVTDEIVDDTTDDIEVKGVKIVGTIKKIFKKKQQEQKIEIFNRTELILK